MRLRDPLNPFFVLTLLYTCYFSLAGWAAVYLCKVSTDVFNYRVVAPLVLGFVGLQVGALLGRLFSSRIPLLEEKTLKIVLTLTFVLLTALYSPVISVSLKVKPFYSVLLALTLWGSVGLAVLSLHFFGFNGKKTLLTSSFLLFFSLILAVSSILMAGGPPFFTGRQPPPYTWPIAIGFSLGLFSFSLLLVMVEARYIPFIVVVSSLVFPFYGYVGDLFVFLVATLVVGYYRRLVKGRYLPPLVLALLATALATRYVKALATYEVWTYDPLKTVFCRLADSFYAYVRVASECFPFGAPGLGAGWIWLSGICPNILIGRVFLGVDKGIAPTFIGNPLADGGLPEVFLYSLFTGFSLAFAYGFKRVGVGLACYSVCLSEFVVRFERGFSAYELTIFLISLCLCLGLPLLKGGLANPRDWLSDGFPDDPSTSD